jgi:hypothetical protein
MIKGFYEFINEGKNYQLFRGVSGIKHILENEFIENSGVFDSPLRKDVTGVKYGISATRNFHTAVEYSHDCVIEFDVPKLTDKYRLLPFSENPDYFLYYIKKYGRGEAFKKMRVGKNKKDSENFWKVKTDKGAMDFDIAEEIIVTNKISIKYIKKLYLNKETYNKIKNLTDKLGIECVVISDMINKKYIHTTDKYRELMKKRELTKQN